MDTCLLSLSLALGYLYVIARLMDAKFRRAVRSRQGVLERAQGPEEGTIWAHRLGARPRTGYRAGGEREDEAVMRSISAGRRNLPVVVWESGVTPRRLCSILKIVARPLCPLTAMPNDTPRSLSGDADLVGVTHFQCVMT